VYVNRAHRARSTGRTGHATGQGQPGAPGASTGRARMCERAISCGVYQAWSLPQCGHATVVETLALNR
jgi:hypothetical protein